MLGLFFFQTQYSAAWKRISLKLYERCVRSCFVICNESMQRSPEPGVGGLRHAGLMRAAWTFNMAGIRIFHSTLGIQSYNCKTIDNSLWQNAVFFKLTGYTKLKSFAVLWRLLHNTKETSGKEHRICKTRVVFQLRLVLAPLKPMRSRQSAFYPIKFLTVSLEVRFVQ